MMAAKQDVPLPSYDGVASGEIAGSATALVMPTVTVRPGMLYLKAQADNAGKVYVGGAGVTVPGGTEDATSGYPLAAGETLGPLVVENLNLLYRICDNAGDDLSYLITK